VLSEWELREVFALMNIVKGLESLGDVLESVEGKLLEKNGEGDLSQEGKDDDRMKCIKTDSVGNPVKVEPSDLLN
jgi:hypothetical protein